MTDTFSEGNRFSMEGPSRDHTGEKPIPQVGLARTPRKWAPQLLLSIVIDRSTDMLSFNTYRAFTDFVLCDDDSGLQSLKAQGLIGDIDLSRFKDRSTYTTLKGKRFLPYTDSDAYRVLKVATEAFVAANCAVPLPGFFDHLSSEVEEALLHEVNTESPGRSFQHEWKRYLENMNGHHNVLLPYLARLRSKLKDVDIIALQPPSGFEEEFAACEGIIAAKLTEPCLFELIWSYWHEEGMLVQTMNAITRRFQNIRGPVERDPLAMLEVGFLRPLNNLIWGYVQDEQHRLSVVRRAYEYDHHYGITLEGNAVPALRTADSRSKFLEAFHNLLYLCSVFFRQDDDTTVIADGFPVLNALKDVHMLLTEGAHNQFGDLPSTARIEMLMQQWLLARPEFRDLLPTRESVAYPEEWMERVDAMKKLQGWIDTSALHFRNLAIYGEKVLLSIRFTEWNQIDDPAAAVVWARFWRARIQGYIYAYYTVTGVDLTAATVWQQQRSLVTTQPSVLLRQRLQGGVAAPQLPAGTPAAAAALPPFRERQTARKQQP